MATRRVVVMTVVMVEMGVLMVVMMAIVIGDDGVDSGDGIY